ncbi:MAG: hypothetical protein RBS80_26120 [Thermoguttaceae bacterium]|jgi:hypothetical protein|nr:hypothetical protein [Thermoguttaceae bacterium]
MDFWNYTTTREACSKAGGADPPDAFYESAMAKAVAMRSAQFLYQLRNERDWEQQRRPYYNVWPSILPMLTRLNLDLDSVLIQLPMPALCVRLPKQQNPLAFDWKGQTFHIRCMLVGDMGDGQAISLLIDVGEIMNNGAFDMPIYSYSNFPKQEGLTVEQSLAGLEKKGRCAELGVQLPDALVTDCVRLCCSLCLLENDPSVIEPDVLSKDRVRYEASGDDKYIDKAHRRGKVGWNVGRQIEVAPHYRRPHMMLAWTGAGRAVPKVVPRRGSVVHREKVEKVPSGFGG